jgi:hypothetical protein
MPKREDFGPADETHIVSLARGVDREDCAASTVELRTTLYVVHHDGAPLDERCLCVGGSGCSGGGSSGSGGGGGR